MSVTWTPVTQGLPDIGRLALAGTLDNRVYLIQRDDNDTWAVMSLDQHVSRWMRNRLYNIIDKIYCWMYMPDLPQYTMQRVNHEWQMPRETSDGYSIGMLRCHAAWWAARIARQQEIDASIAANADYEYLYDRPYVDRNIVRVTGPFEVVSVTPTQTFTDDAVNTDHDAAFVRNTLEALRINGVQQAHKTERIRFSSLDGWPGRLICAIGVYDDNGIQQRAAIMIGSEYGTLSRDDMAAAAREAVDAGCNILIACAFSFDANDTQIDTMPVLRARMNADLHMVDALKNTTGGNLFVVFGEPDITIEQLNDGYVQIRLNGVDVYSARTGQVESNSADDVACWFVDDDFDGSTFFVRQAYFPGTVNDPYRTLQATLKAAINEETWQSLRCTVSRPFRPAGNTIAVKVINHLGDEVIRVINRRPS